MYVANLPDRRSYIFLEMFKVSNVTRREGFWPEKKRCEIERDTERKGKGGNVEAPDFLDRAPTVTCRLILWSDNRRETDVVCGCVMRRVIACKVR